MFKPPVIILLVILFCINGFSVFAQTSPFAIHLEPISISGLSGIQSYAVGQHNGKLLIIGGRLDGLHRRQPWASFDIAGHNNQLLVIDPVSMQKWSAPLTSLSASLQEQLSATNMNFYQEGDFLYIIGGYGYSATLNDHTTFPHLTAVKVSDAISAIMNTTSFTSYFRQITDPLFKVTGGRLRKIYNTYYLLGGHSFDGRYNPMNNPTFTQVYTNSIRKFTITDDGTNITINHLPSYTDSINLHRRDYNAEAQILPNGQEGITMFSGVFQSTVNLPFLNCVIIDSNNYTVNNSFQQYYNHYHCAVLPLYAASMNEMHHVFFGGISQYYDSAGTLVQNNDVPFVKTIARVSRNASGIMSEHKLPIEMPSLLGAGSEFIINKNLPHYHNEVLKFDEFTTDSTMVGYIFGGISSTGANIFWINDGTQSQASSQLFKVYVLKNTALGSDDLNELSLGSLQLQVYPNPNGGVFELSFHLSKSAEAKLSIYSHDGKPIEEKLLGNLPSGLHTIKQHNSHIHSRGTYLVTIETPYEKATQTVIIKGN